MKRLIVGVTAALCVVLPPQAAAVEFRPGDILVADRDAFAEQPHLGGPGGVIHVDPDTGVQTTVSAGGSFINPSAIALEADGDILVTDPHALPDFAPALIRVDPATGGQTTVVSSAGFTTPSGVAVEADGDILVADMGSWQGGLVRVDPVTGAHTTVSWFASLRGVAVEADGNILVTEVDEWRRKVALIRVDPATGAQTTVSSGGFFSLPWGIAVEADGKILVADEAAFGSGLIRVDPVTGAQTMVTRGGLFERPWGVALEADGGILVAESNPFTGTLIRVDPATGVQTAASSKGSFRRPSGVAVVPTAATYTFTGFYAPVDNGQVNLAKAGSSVPVRFSLGGDQGVDVLADGYPKLEFYPCDPDTPGEPVEQTSTANPGLNYDALTDTYTYVWKTNKGWSGKCGTFTLKLDDDSVHTADFQFK